MENTNQNVSQFQLKNGSVIIVPGTSQAYSNANLTDEVALDYLAKNPNRKQNFKTVPDNLNELIAQHQAKGVDVFLTDENAITIGTEKVTVEQAIGFLKEIGVATKATSVTGVQKKVSELSEEDNAKIVALVSSPDLVVPPVDEATPAAPATPADNTEGAPAVTNTDANSATTENAPAAADTQEPPASNTNANIDASASADTSAAASNNQ